MTEAAPAAHPGDRTESEPLLTADFVRKLDRFDIALRRVLSGRTKGERRSKRRGQSVEFADHKNYVVGDDLRHIDWNIYARLDKLFVKLFLEEEDLHLHLLVDTSGSMDYGRPSKLTYARRLAAALGYIGLVNANRVMVHPFADHLLTGTPQLRGKHQTPVLMDFLGRLRAAEPTSDTLGERQRSASPVSDLTPAARGFAVRRGGQGVVVLMSDFFHKAGYERAFSYLLGLKMDLYVIHVLAEEEVRPNLVGDLQLIDREDGSAVEVTISAPLLAQYQRTLDSFRNGLRDFCTRRGVQYLFVSTRTPFEPVVLSLLRRQGLLK